MRAAEALARFRNAPPAGLDAIVRGPFTVLAPHPDDESLGCGGLIAQAAAAGIPAHVVVLTDGTGSHPNSRRFPAPALAALREGEARAAVRALGLSADRVAFLHAPDTRAPHAGPAFDALVDALALRLRATGSRTLFATWRHDPHGDHAAAHLIAAAAARRAGARLMSYPVWGWTLPDDTEVDAPAAMRLDVSGQLAAKRRAIAAHRSQMTDLIDDDPDGFRLPEDFVALHTGTWEVFLDA
ncbi:PIG-L deacetylase family protein [Acidisphaera rubrifaciens]|uniref:LmbE family protein n=1 Tax=Acidisphaera rubrifaciens HS-AP3 TaxID=1231350 RepID=A0A0D6P5X7_9PROT|nr:PIG-L family deacetylase [Acidisphaera rubrifaciens]GAN77087.1 hypothetical protein Asru_0231_09 [Acidisphaera rubrifaciens HS-AP3]